MDIEIERQGYPTAFTTAQEAEIVPHEVTNVVASTSNAQSSPQKSVMHLESSEPVATFAAAEMLQPVSSTPEVLNTRNGVIGDTVNGNHMPQAGSSDQPQLRDNSSTQQSQSFESSLPVSIVAESITTMSASAPEESSVLPGEVAEVATEVDLIPEQSISDIHTDPATMPEQPVSDLRSVPLTDTKEEAQPLNLVSATLVSATEDLSMPSEPGTLSRPLPMPQSNNIMSQSPSAVSGDLAPPAAETSVAPEIQLPSPPVSLPPPSSRPADSILSEDETMTDAHVADLQDDSSTPVAPTTLTTEEPHDPAPTPAAAIIAQGSDDHTMVDAPEPPPTKVTREREDDNDELEPSAKRAKTEAELSDFKVPELPTAAQTSPATNGTSSTSEDDTITSARLAHMKKIISNLKKGNSSTAFRVPVDYVTLGIPTYPDVIKEPMDLSTIDTKLKNKQYTRVRDFVRDFELVVNNSYTFNGREHVISQQAAKMETSFHNQMRMMPPASLVEPSKEEKKLQKPKTEAVRQAPPRRQSVSAGNARSPSGSNNPQTFALGPEGVPLIRRDSNVNDGRAKRAVVPPKRHSDFGGRPKKKKYELELKFCWEVLKELQLPKHWQFAQFFYSPVDPVALNIPTYFQIIKKPMDLGTIQTKLEKNAYEKASEFKEDVQLIFKNCYKFNPEGEFVNDCGHKLEEVFEKKWQTKEDWLAARQPDSEPHTDVEDDEDEQEEESEEDEDTKHDRNEKIKQLQKEIMMMQQRADELAQPVHPKKKNMFTPPMPLKKSKTKGDKKEKSAVPKVKEEAAPKKKVKKVKEEKERFVTYNEKQYISNGISQLPDKQMGEALKLIQQNVPSLKGVEEAEIELDIDELPNQVLLKLLRFVEKSGGGPLPPAAPATEAVYAAPAVSAGKPKKNKPMGKTEQEAQIAELRGKLDNFKTEGDPLSPNAVQSIENDMDTSGDEASDSEESEEE